MEEVVERDPVTGRKTTGHEWNGIKELDTPVPRVVLFFLHRGHDPFRDHATGC